MKPPTPTAAEGSRVLGFFDLRRFALDPSAGSRPAAPGAPGLANAFATQRRELALGDAAVQVGAINLPAGQGQAVDDAADEFIHVCAGEVAFDDGTGGLHRLAAGSSAVVPQGCRLNWHAASPATLVYLRCPGSAQAAPALRIIDQGAPLSPSGAPLAELLTSATPQCRNHTDFESANGELVCGTWDSTPYTRRPMTYRHVELMHLLEGSVTLEDAAGRRHSFAAHDLLLVERGAHCSWHSPSFVKKVYAIHRPA